MLLPPRRRAKILRVCSRSPSTRAISRKGRSSRGIIVGIEKDLAVIDVGLKTEGRVPVREFTGPGRQNELKVGDTVEVYLERVENAPEQGIGKDGNSRVRAAMVELAWMWLRWQPDSALSVWFRARVGAGGGRIRKIMIVALARKLLVALWRYVKDGVIPEGARMKAA